MLSELPYTEPPRVRRMKKKTTTPSAQQHNLLLPPSISKGKSFDFDRNAYRHTRYTHGEVPFLVFWFLLGGSKELFVNNWLIL